MCAMGEHHEVERKFELPAGRQALPALEGIDGVTSVGEPISVEQDATYLDTADLRLARHGITLRRRTGGDDEGWHLKVPVAADERVELQVPLDASADDVPEELAALVRAR